MRSTWGSERLKDFNSDRLTLILTLSLSIIKLFSFHKIILLTKPEGQYLNHFQIQRQSSTLLCPSMNSLGGEIISETKTAFTLWFVWCLVFRIQVFAIFPPFVHLHFLAGFLFWVSTTEEKRIKSKCSHEPHLYRSCICVTNLRI